MMPRKAAISALGRDVTVLGLLWGSSVVLQRLAVSEQDATTVVALRLLAAVVIGALNPASTGLLSAVALQHASSGVVAVLASLGPVFTALLAGVVLHEQPLRRPQLLGLGLAFVGVAVLISTRSSGLGSAQSDDLRGQLFALLVAVIMAFATVYSRRQLTGVDPLASSAGQITAALLIVLPLMLLFGPPLVEVRFSTAGWLAVIVSGAIGLSASFILFLGMIERHGPTAALLALYVMPVAAALLGALFLGESLSPSMLAGAAFVLLGVALFTRR
jgi:drug/metabolite transporter (DMT)-like permease